MEEKLLSFSLLLAVAFCVSWEAHGYTPPRSLLSMQADKTASLLIAKRLASRNPLERRAAAEEVARLSAVEHRRMVEGYRLQEKDSRVRVALDWALYRTGKNEALFSLVRALDSKQSEQTLGYLSQLESPDPLYVFLKRVNGNTQIRLLEVLARVGNGSTLEEIKPFTASLDPGIADAAKFAEREITIRLEEAPAVAPKRPRQVSKGEESQP
ncbi:MAG: hypothetical protein LC754_13410 [Acidobacteria bacterium]|nr:hypothetical protein [Acidobacteriota bacterium]